MWSNSCFHSSAARQPDRRFSSAALLAAGLLLCPSAARAADPAGGGDEDGGEINLEAPAEPEDLAPWRGSEFSYRNVATIRGMDRSAELTWNPYWAMEFGFKFRWYFDEHWFAGARLEVTREVTEADDTTYAGEAWLQDLLLSGGGTRLVTIPGVGIDLSADVTLTLPTSKVSQARTLYLGIGPDVRLSRSWELGGEWEAGYHVRFNAYFHEATTAERETPLIPTCASSGRGCEAFVNTGLRNARWRVQHGVDLSYQPLDWLGFSAAFEHIVDGLYPIEGDDPRISWENESPTDLRHASAFEVEATFAPIPALEIGIGYSTISPQLAPDSTYYNPFYNRYTTVYLDLRLEIEGLVEQLTEAFEGGAAT